MFFAVLLEYYYVFNTDYLLSYLLPLTPFHSSFLIPHSSFSTDYRLPSSCYLSRSDNFRISMVGEHLL